VFTATTEGITLAITGGKSGKGVSGELLSLGNVHPGLACCPVLVGGAGVVAGDDGKNREQPRTPRTKLTNTRTVRIYLTRFAIYDGIITSCLSSRKISFLTPFGQGRAITKRNNYKKFCQENFDSAI